MMKKNKKQTKKKSKKHKHKWLRRIFRFAFIIAGLCIIVVVGCNMAVSNSAKGRLYDDVSQIPYRKVGVVLGTNPFLNSGNLNYYYDYRMKAAAKLYHEHKITYIVVSGDNRKKGYDEATEMLNSLVALGVPDSVICPDYAGRSTYESMVRAKEVFCLDSVTVISQPWHNKRAVFIAKHKGMDAIAFNAQDIMVRATYIKLHLRETLSRVKAVWDLFTNRKAILGDNGECKFADC